MSYFYLEISQLNLRVRLESNLAYNFEVAFLGMLFYTVFFGIVFFWGNPSTDFEQYKYYLTNVPRFKEPVFYLSSFLYDSGLSDKFAIYSPYYIFSLLALIVIVREVSLEEFFIFIFLLASFFLFQQFNTARQSTAGLIALAALLSRSRFARISLIFGSLLIHKSAALFMPILFLNSLNFRRGLLFCFFIGFYLAANVLDYGNLGLVLRLIGFDSYVYYLDSNFEFKNNRADLSLVYLVFGLAFIWLRGLSDPRLFFSVLIFILCFSLYDNLPFLIRLTPLLKPIVLMSLSILLVYYFRRLAINGFGRLVLVFVLGVIFHINFAIRLLF